jgi:hypothetical protein
MPQSEQLKAIILNRTPTMQMPSPQRGGEDLESFIGLNIGIVAIRILLTSSNTAFYLMSRAEVL